VAHRAASLQLDHGPVLTLLPRGAPLHPWGLTVPLELATLTPGTDAASDGRRLALGPHRIELADAEAPELRIRVHPRGLPPRWVLASLLAAERAPEDGLEAPVLAAALARFRSGNEVEELATLVGVGGGLTPAGDDALVGIVAILELFQAACGTASDLRTRLVDRAVPLLAQRTSRLAAQMLAAAAEGCYAEPVLGLLDALAADTPSPRLIEHAIAELLPLGHRSGADTLRGAAAALDRLIREAAL
jgi:hypothetical protein